MPETKQELAPIQRFSNSIQRFAKQYADALPPECGVTAEMFTANAIAYLGKNDALLDYDERSVMSCLYEGARLGLMPDGAIPGFHIVGFWSGKKQCHVGTFIVDYKAVLELAVRSGMLRSINPGVVYTNDNFEFGLHDGEPFIEHRWDLDASKKDRGELRGVYCTGILPDGSKARPVWMNVADLADYAQKYALDKKGNLKGLWAGDKADLLIAYRKTIVRQFLTFVPKSASNLAMSTRLGDTFAADSKGTAGYTPDEAVPTRDVDATVSRASPGARAAEEDLGIDGGDDAPPDESFEPEPGAEKAPAPTAPTPTPEEVAAREEAREQQRVAAAEHRFKETITMSWDIGTRYVGKTIGEISGDDEGLRYLHDAMGRLGERPQLQKRLRDYLDHPMIAPDLEVALNSTPADGTAD